MSDRDNITLPREVVEVAFKALVSKGPWSDADVDAYSALRKALAAEPTTQDIEALRRENERLREVLWLALRSQGRMLMRDPPLSAWKFNRVEEKARVVLRREEPT